MAKKQTRRSISVSGDTYNAVRDYCDKHGLSASGLVTDLLDKYLIDNAAGPPPSAARVYAEDPADDDDIDEVDTEEEPSEEIQPMPQVSLAPPQPVRGGAFPDRRGPGFSPLPEGVRLSNWRITAEIEISRKRQLDAQTSVETLLMNLVHRRMVNGASIVKVDQED